VTLTLDGNRIKSSGPMRNDSQFDAYDRYMVAPRMPLDDSPAQSFLNRVATSVRVQGSRFTYDVTPGIVQSGLESMARFVDGQFSLPADWKLPRFTLQQFRLVARVMWVLAMIHFCARTAASTNGCRDFGFSCSLLFMDKTEIVRQLCRYSGVAEDAVIAIVEDLTYGARGQTHPDPALQPIIPLSASTVAMSPSLVMSSSMERNLTVLLNRLPEERAAYAALTQEKETKLRKHLMESLSDLGFRFWYGRVPEWGAGSDIDFVVISDVEQECLILELKSFIAPAEAREVRDRSEEIRRGIEQLRIRKELARIFPGPLRALIGVGDQYRLNWAVASETSVGANYVQSPDVPVINARHLISKLCRDRSLTKSCFWLDERRYLPIEGVHYREVEVESKIGKFILEWYGITDLIDNYAQVDR
jgi:hypothetical protein